MFGFKLIRESDLESVYARLRAAEDTLATTTRQVRDLDADFTDLWDRVQKQVNRLVKRDQRQEAAGEANEQPAMVPHRPLTPAQQAALEVGRRMGMVK
jgi:hypothetical protein